MHCYRNQVLNFLQFRFCSAITEGSRRHNALRARWTLLGSQAAWESHLTFCRWHLHPPVGHQYHKPPETRRSWATLNISRHSFKLTSFEVTNSFSTILTNTPCAPFALCGLVVFLKSLIRSVHINAFISWPFKTKPSILFYNFSLSPFHINSDTLKRVIWFHLKRK